MSCSPLNQMMNLCRYEPPRAQSSETAAERNQKFAEEYTFFYSFFKNRTVKPMPDVGLLMVLKKDKTRKKKRMVAKSKKPQNPYFTRKQPEEYSTEESTRES